MELFLTSRIDRAVVVALRTLAITALAVVSVFGLSSTKADAAASISFTSPTNGSSAPVGTMVMPEGIAGASGGSGTGLDLVLVLDSSGSMSASIGGGQSRGDAQRAAAIALVQSLPTANTSVAVVDFDGNASVTQTLIPLTPLSNINQVIAAINAINESGSTDIRDGIVSGAGELIANGTAGRSQQMVLVSDGGSSQSAAVTAATNALAAGITVNTVAIPGASTSVLDAVATAGGGTFTDVSGATGTDDLVALFDGTGGNLVGVDTVDITMPDGSILADIPVDALGNFKVPAGFNLLNGANTWTALVTATDGSTASATVTVNGTLVPAVPLPAGAPLMLAGLAALGFLRLRRRS